MTSTLAPVGVERFRQQLEEDGYVILRQIVDPRRLGELAERLTAEYTHGRDTGVLFRGGGSYAGHLNCFPGEQSRFVYDELVARGVVELIGSVRPDAVDKVRVTVNLNLPGSVAQHYHADGLYADEFLICNVAVVDTTEHNGALDVLPGTHRRHYEFWRYALERKYRLTTRLPMQCGDVVVRRSTLWHRGAPNRSHAVRPMIGVTFGEPCADGHDPFAVNGGAVSIYPNWFPTSRLGRVRERVFVAAPMTLSCYRFARSLYGKR